MDKESGQRLSKVLNGWTLTRCSKPHKIVMWFKQLITTNIRQYLLKLPKLCIPIVVILMIVVNLGCTTYIREIPHFPEAKILKIYFPMQGQPYQEYRWIVWANNATDSLEVKTYLKGYKEVILVQGGRFYHSPKYPISGLDSDWMPLGEGKFELQFRAFNKYTEDWQVRWIDVKYPAIYKSWN